MNRPLDDLRAALPATDAEVYGYVIATIGRADERFVQYGSAPKLARRGSDPLHLQTLHALVRYTG